MRRFINRKFVTITIYRVYIKKKKKEKKCLYLYKFFSRQITVSTIDRRKLQLVYKINIIEMDSNIMVDFRLSKGDGIEFKKSFVKVKNSLADIIGKELTSWWCMTSSTSHISNVYHCIWLEFHIRLFVIWCFFLSLSIFNENCILFMKMSESIIRPIKNDHEINFNCVFICIYLDRM